MESFVPCAGFSELVSVGMPGSRGSGILPAVLVVFELVLQDQGTGMH